VFLTKCERLIHTNAILNTEKRKEIVLKLKHVDHSSKIEAIHQTDVILSYGSVHGSRSNSTKVCVNVSDFSQQGCINSRFFNDCHSGFLERVRDRQRRPSRKGGKLLGVGSPLASHQLSLSKLYSYDILLNEMSKPEENQELMHGQ
jgi:hypothetical protein